MGATNGCDCAYSIDFQGQSIEWEIAKKCNSLQNKGN